MEYVHREKKSGERLYNYNFVKWLIHKGFIPSDRSTKILDLGSGRGHVYFSLKNMGFKNVTAVDFSPAFKECIKGDIKKKLPFKDNSFDLVISSHVAEHVRESEKFFGEQRRILNRGGIIIVATPNAESMSLGEFYDDYTHVMPYTRKSLLEAFTMNGFEKAHTRRLRAIPILWRYTISAFDFLFSSRKNNLLGVARKK